MWSKKVTYSTINDLLLMAEWAYNHPDFHQNKTRKKHLDKIQSLSKLMRHNKINPIKL